MLMDSANGYTSTISEEREREIREFAGDGDFDDKAARIASALRSAMGMEQPTCLSCEQPMVRRQKKTSRINWVHADTNKITCANSEVEGRPAPH